MKHLRKKDTAKKIWIVLIIIILPAFVLWGLGSASRAKGRINYAGKIFGKKVPLQEFADAYSAVLTQGILRWGEENFAKMVKELDLKQEAWSRIILLKEAKKRNIRVSDKELAIFIESSPMFQYNGRFNMKAYKEILQFVLHVNVPVFESQMRENIMIAKLYNQVTAQVKLSNEQIRQAEENRKEGEKKEGKQLTDAEKEIFTKELLFKEKDAAFNKFLQQSWAEAKIEDNTQALKVEP
ncbi:MAG: SurA N-terminal domain-containing protein [Candidatus Omnitrophica bacterium]|nr:SurA N-terminal domain-containing protein [Candidatus Omnitrophota bacterium]MDD5236874.1 SurA N-terminal domain-containing protein [Candidatus Omnitrophota bacterium]MDD5610282.1 SurA N-terminal domain-containing protein [Candidatus Omnitrophota bacterium]